jgi:hypothetical protein
MGRRTDGREDEILQGAQAPVGGAVRVCGMDTGYALAAFEVRSARVTRFTQRDD